MKSIEGLEKTQAAINKLLRTKQGKMAEIVEKSLADVANHAKANHERNSAHGAGRFESQTGTLIRSISQKLTRVDPVEISGKAFVGEDYGVYVEFGTARSAPYPFMRPALEAVKPVFIKRLNDLI